MARTINTNGLKRQDNSLNTNQGNSHTGSNIQTNSYHSTKISVDMSQSSPNKSFSVRKQYVNRGNSPTKQTPKVKLDDDINKRSLLR